MSSLKVLPAPCRRSLALILSLLLAPLAAAAHPHVYIDAALGLVYDGKGRLAAIEVSWSYDELYSLLIIEDLGLDPDGDGVLEPEERDRLAGFDGDWEPGFDGRLYLVAEGRPVALQDPEGFAADYAEGRVVSRHLRPLVAPLPVDADLSVQVYDPEFYVDFTLMDAPRFDGRADCRASFEPGDPTAAPEAYRMAVDAALVDATNDAEAELIAVDIGAAGADLLTITCAGAGEVGAGG